MTQLPKRRWVPRFSLKTLLLGCLVIGCGLAPLAHCCYEYRAEQRLIESINSRKTGNLMTVTTSGQSAYVAGYPYC